VLRALVIIRFLSDFLTNTLVGIQQLGSLKPEDTVFFPLHTAVDEHHQAAIQAISTDFAGSEQGRAEVRRGMLKALSLRSAFWDWLYERALDPVQSQEAV
jgi:hypothetical protein